MEHVSTAETHSKTSASVKSYALCRSLSPNNAVTSAISFLLYCVTSLLQRQFDTRDQITLIKTNELNNSLIMGARSRDVRLFPKKDGMELKKEGSTNFFPVIREGNMDHACPNSLSIFVYFKMHSFR